ncbi:COQ9-domain-containing protein [Dipodascopsis uninucleata]
MIGCSIKTGLRVSCHKLSGIQGVGISTRLWKSYHSYEHLAAKEYTGSQEKILTAALKRVPEFGFVKDSIVYGCRDVGLLDTTHAGFHNGVMDLIRYHLYTQRQKLSSIASKINEDDPIYYSRVEKLCIERLKGNFPIISRWTEAVAVMTLPPNLPISMLELSALSDDICFYAGDKSTDFDWYIRRASVAAVYSSAELFMTQDQSPDFQQTWDFVRRRIENVNNVKSVIDNGNIWLAFTGISTLNLIRSQLSRG